MRFDWTINLNIVLILTAGILAWGKFFLMVRDEFRDIKAILREYPPHRHVGTGIIYPKDMDPEG